MSEQPKTVKWPPDYTKLFAWRQKQLRMFRQQPEMLIAARTYYRDPKHAADFIADWVDTYDPRNAGQKGKMTHMPFVLFPRQRELVDFLMKCLMEEADGLIEKCRDAGVTWLAVGLSVYLWLFWPGIAVGWGSRKEQLVDKLGVPDSIFEKIRLVIRSLPPEFLPTGFNAKEHMTYMRVLNPATGATLIGEAGDNIGRGGRTRMYIKDESAHYERPELIEAALGDNTRVQIDVSSVNGIGNVFHRKRESGVVWTGGDVVKGKTNVFVFDWRDHPEKTQEWYDQRRAKAEAEGMLHIFAQEVDRDYAASVEGVIIPQEWIRAAIDAHIKLGFSDDGQWVAGLDVADGGLDRNALAQRKGVVLRAVDEWGDRDTGATTRHALGQLIEPSHTWLMYDCIGVGAGVKAETNRLAEEGVLNAGLRIEPWNAGATALFPEENIIRGDRESPMNKDYYANLKAQAWWELRQRVWRTWQAVVHGVYHEVEDMISISSEIKDIHGLVKELSQATGGLTSSKLKFMVNKTPSGSRSPNRADAVVMAFWPVSTSRFTLENL